jgi:hypothetical protein
LKRAVVDVNSALISKNGSGVNNAIREEYGVVDLHIYIGTGVSI